MAEARIHPLAQVEYDHALDWYYARSPRAASGFEAAFEQAVRFIESHPDANLLLDKRHRRCPLRRYPYGIVYRVESDQIIIVAVHHDRQLPDSWTNRA